MRFSGVSAIPFPSPGRVLRPISAATRSFTACGKACGLAMWSTSFHCCARSARTPSLVVQKKSARSRRTLRLSVTRVSPPVPGSTPSSGTSGRLTAEERSSIMRISSQASASSYPPPATAPLSAARNLRPSRLESSMPLRVSLVNLQKFTFQPWVESPSM